MDPGEVKPCRPCEIAWGTFGVLAGLILLAIGTDLVTGGWLTRALTRSEHEQSG
jgi:hypothetical protein